MESKYRRGKTKIDHRQFIRRRIEKRALDFLSAATSRLFDKRKTNEQSSHDHRRIRRDGWCCLFPSITDREKRRYDPTYLAQDAMTDPIAFTASRDPDTLYLHQAMKSYDAKQFKQAMQSEFKAHCDNKPWEIVPRHTVPKGMIILPAVWSMKRKRRIDTREVYKHKAQLTIHGGKQMKGLHYWETYAPVVCWSSIRFFLLLAITHGWKSKQIDFVLAYPQADVECDLYC